MSNRPELSPALRLVIDAIENAATRFPRILEGTARIAFSGGKDSLALAYALKSMGYAPTLSAVDMGYSKEWRARIQRKADELLLPLEMLVVGEVARDGTVSSSARNDLILRRAFLDSPDAAASAATPCTNCYNCKLLSLIHAPYIDYSNILFAHHRTDALSSFLKSAVMYIDRWEFGHEFFDRKSFRRVGKILGEGLRSGDLTAVARLETLIADKKAHTSEPPLERGTIHGRSYTIARPLFFADEEATVALARELGIEPERSGCGHTLAAATRTPREIVHLELLPWIGETAAGRQALSTLFELIIKALFADGTATFNSRASRHALLGDQYKGEKSAITRRL